MKSLAICFLFIGQIVYATENKSIEINNLDREQHELHLKLLAQLNMNDYASSNTTIGNETYSEAEEFQIVLRKK
jgi:hypothetical protein